MQFSGTLGVFFNKHIQKSQLICILLEINIAPENWWLEDYFPFGIAYYQVLCEFQGRYISDLKCLDTIDTHNSWFWVTLWPPKNPAKTSESSTISKRLDLICRPQGRSSETQNIMNSRHMNAIYIYIHTHLTYVFIYWDSPPARRHIVTARNIFHFWVTRHAKLNFHFPRLHPGRGLAPINGCIYLQRFPSKQRNLYKIVCMSIVETSCSRTNLHPVHL